MDYATVYLIAALVVLVIHIILAYQASIITDAKGYSGTTWGILCFLTGFCACILVAALPDKNQIKREKKIADTLDTLLTLMRNQHCAGASSNETPTPANDTLKRTKKQSASSSPKPRCTALPNGKWVCATCKTINPEKVIFCATCGLRRTDLPNVQDSESPKQPD